MLVSSNTEGLTRYADMALEELAAEQEVTVDYYMMEFL